MNYRFALSGALIALCVISPLRAADIAAGKKMALFVCSDCHGPTGVSVVENFPNLAGQKELYLAMQIKAFRAGKRKNSEMNIIAKRLSDADIANLAAFFSMQSCPPKRPRN